MLAQTRRVATCGLLAFAIVFCAGCGSFSPISSIERSLIYHPSPYPEGDWQPTNASVEDVFFTAEDGAKLHGWYLHHPAPRAVVLFTHGNAGNITSRIDLLRTLNQQHGLAVMAFDYRGYGRSEGSPDEQGVLNDARAARVWLARRTNVTEREIVLFGRSLGGAVAVDLAARDGASGLILVSTFTSVPAVGSHHMWWLPTNLLMKERFDSLSKIGRYPGPLLYAHGDADELIPISQGRRLFDAATGTKQFITLPGGRHNTPLGLEFHTALDAFIEVLPRTAQANPDCHYCLPLGSRARLPYP
ncbi:MAG: alpha/beta hydrolase [Pirellulales bacterium]|nr:alpha/beta hydrolase [Pirellulales bacterium]